MAFKTWCIEEGEWKLEMWHGVDNGAVNFSRKHKHENVDVSVIWDEKNTYICDKCGERTPDVLTGFIELLHWSNKDNKNANRI